MSAPAVVVDSSVAFKWFARDAEAAVNEAAAMLEAHAAGEIVLCAPEHLVLEVLNALKSRGLGKADMQRAAEALLAARLELTSASELAVSAARIAVEYDLTLYDAAFAALAVELDAELVTADRRLAQAGACETRLLG